MEKIYEEGLLEQMATLVFGMGFSLVPGEKSVKVTSLWSKGICCLGQHEPPLLWETKRITRQEYTRLLMLNIQEKPESEMLKDPILC